VCLGWIIGLCLLADDAESECEEDEKRHDPQYVATNIHGVSFVVVL
jgi:hypothetical protein